MNIRFCRLARGGVLLALAALLAACAPIASRPDNSRPDNVSGKTVRAAFASQVADPAAVRNTKPVVGLDGPAALAINERYERSYSSPPEAPAPLSVIGSGLK